METKQFQLFAMLIFIVRLKISCTMSTLHLTWFDRWWTLGTLLTYILSMAKCHVCSISAIFANRDGCRHCIMASTIVSGHNYSSLIFFI